MFFPHYRIQFCKSPKAPWGKEKEKTTITGIKNIQWRFRVHEYTACQRKSKSHRSPASPPPSSSSHRVLSRRKWTRHWRQASCRQSVSPFKMFGVICQPFLPREASQFAVDHATDFRPVQLAPLHGLSQHPSLDRPMNSHATVYH